MTEYKDYAYTSSQHGFRDATYTTHYYDCKRNSFASQAAAVAWYVEKHGKQPVTVITTSTGWMVGPVPEEATHGA